MQTPLQITFRGLGHSDAIEQHVRRKAAELEQFAEDITSCHVTVEAPHRRHRKGNLYTVRLDLRLPGQEIVVGQERHRNHAHEDVHVAIRDAFDAAVRRLEDYVRRRRGKVKQHEPPVHGKVAALFSNEGYGFVELPDGVQVYFHENSVANGAFSALRVGQEVRVALAEGEGEKGPQASSIIPVGKRHVTGVAWRRP